MSDWQVGDLAVCVDAGPRRHPRTGRLSPHTHLLTVGAVYSVNGVVPDGSLMLAEIPLQGNGEWGPSFRADRFRKIRPDAHEACEAEFVTLLKRKKVSA